MSFLVIFVKTKANGQSNRYTTVVVSSIRFVALLQVSRGQSESLDKIHVSDLKIVRKETLLRLLKY